MIAERDDDFAPLKAASRPHGDEPVWSLSSLKECLGYGPDEKIDGALARAKIAAQTAGIPIKEHFVAGELFDAPGEIFLTKVASLLVTVNANPAKEKVAIAQSYFALQTDRQAMEDQKRLQTRLRVNDENRKLQGSAKSAGVVDYQKFQGVGLAALYGGNNQARVKSMKGLPQSSVVLDHAGSEELAANLFRITQTHAALQRQDVKSESLAIATHERVGKGIRTAILNAGNIPPERRRVSLTKIDKLATKVEKSLKPGRK